MFRSRNPRLRVVAVFALMLIFSAVAYGFAAANTVPASTAGDGSGAVSGYTISAVHYVLNGTNPANIDTVTFATAPVVPAAGVVKVEVSQGASTSWHNCTVAGANATCNLTQDSGGAPTTVTALGITNLRVVAAQ
jgi:hypothetical protein